jgi:hypothetical protein
MFMKMSGRSCATLLAIFVSMLAPARLCGQSRSANTSSVDSVPAPSLHPAVIDQPGVQALPPRLPISPPGTPWGPIGFPALSRAAGTIFSGTVTAILRRPATRGSAVETVAITFHIENAIRGATAGQNLTISQWIALWSGGQRYRVGEHVLLFLYPPSKLGLTSCVGGALGRFIIDPRGRVLLSAQHLSAFRTDPVLGGKSRVSFSDFALAVQLTLNAAQE